MYYTILMMENVFSELQTTCSRVSPASCDDVLRCDGGPLDELSDQLETDAPRAPGYKDAASEHFRSFSLLLNIHFSVFGTLAFAFTFRKTEI